MEMEYKAENDEDGNDVSVPDYSYPSKIPESVNYSRLIPFLLKSVQDLKAEIDELKNG